MYNEETRKKAVYENFSFDPEEQSQLDKREAEALELIKNQ